MGLASAPEKDSVIDCLGGLLVASSDHWFAGFDNDEEQSMRGLMGLMVLGFVGTLLVGCGKASCDETKAAADAAECITSGDPASCMEKLGEKYAHCGD